MSNHWKVRSSNKKQSVMKMQHCLSSNLSRKLPKCKMPPQGGCPTINDCFFHESTNSVLSRYKSSDRFGWKDGINKSTWETCRIIGKSDWATRSRVWWKGDNLWSATWAESYSNAKCRLKEGVPQFLIVIRKVRVGTLLTYPFSHICGKEPKPTFLIT